MSTALHVIRSVLNRIKKEKEKKEVYLIERVIEGPSS